MNKIVVAEPIYSGLPPDVYFNRIAFWTHCATASNYKAKAMVLGPRRAIRSARDLAISAAIQLDASHLFFMDDDILVPPEILDRLLEIDRPIAGGLMHRDDGQPIVFRDHVPDETNEGIQAMAVTGLFGEVPWTDHPVSGAFECAAVGSGCMLIQTDVLRTLLRNLDKDFPGAHRWLFNYDESDRSMDVRFCRMARRLGFTVWCWPDVECTQVKHY